MAKLLTDYTHIPLCDLCLGNIAWIIEEDWKENSKSGISSSASPYLEALSGLDNLTDNYMGTSGIDVVNIFLSKADTWKGKIAEAIKIELKERVNKQIVRENNIYKADEAARIYKINH